MKTLLAAAFLVALCLLPAASADPGPDATVTFDTRPAVSCTTSGHSETVGPVTVSEDDCVFVVDHDGNSVVAQCAPQSTPPWLEPRVVVGPDCHVYVYA